MKLTRQNIVRQYAIAIAKSTGRPFTRVSQEFLQRVEVELRGRIQALVHSSPSRKTL
jgi:hypothetical protein